MQHKERKRQEKKKRMISWSEVSRNDVVNCEKAHDIFKE
jgi:hypothetical protein